MFFLFLRFFLLVKYSANSELNVDGDENIFISTYTELTVHTVFCQHFWVFCVFVFFCILSNGVFSFIPFLYKWTRLIFTEPLLAVAAQTRPGGSAVCARQDRGFLSMDKTNLYTTPLISRRADPSRRVCDLRETR